LKNKGPKNDCFFKLKKEAKKGKKTPLNEGQRAFFLERVFVIFGKNVFFDCSPFWQ